jgi:cytochrome b pre-mRNA-processing protein 3
MLSWLRTRALDRRKAGELYGAVVTQARNPAFYARMGVPDRPEGRYEMIVLHLFLLLDRLGADAPATNARAREVIETFVTDMDDCLREFGVGDLAVPKKVKRAAAGLYERAAAYRAALVQPDPAVLARSLAEHALPAATQSAGAIALARYTRRAMVHLQRQTTADLLEGRLSFPAVEDPTEAPHE